MDYYTTYPKKGRETPTSGCACSHRKGVPSGSRDRTVAMELVLHFVLLKCTGCACGAHTSGHVTISRFRLCVFSAFNLQKARTINSFILLFRVLAFMFRLLFPMFFFRFTYIKFTQQ
jgi:hypothetical protein